MKKYYLAIDIGASGGRHILAHLEGKRLYMEEIYRFENHMDEVDGSYVWNIDRLMEEILCGMKKCGETGKIPYSMGIDTWGVDYVLLDEKGKPTDMVFAYRDHRTDKCDKKLEAIMDAGELYKHTGIQKQTFNTVYQLFEDTFSRPKAYEAAKTMLLIPDYLAYMLTGVISTEYTNATTTGLVNAHDGTWDSEIIDEIGFKRSLFSEIVKPGTDIGGLKKEYADYVGFNTRFVKVASHDTASAVAALPTDKETVFISSGTWSLLGTERMAPDCSAEARLRNFTNEGGVEKRYRFLKNIMGMWMIQSIRHEFGDPCDYGSIADMAEEYDSKKEADELNKVIDVNDNRFLSPKSMRDEIDSACRESGCPIPTDIGAYASLIYRSLAAYYKKAIMELEELTGRCYETIHIVGGGSKAVYLNRLIEEYTEKRVHAGPAEATAVGNVFVQMISDGSFKNINDARINTEIKEV